MIKKFIYTVILTIYCIFLNFNYVKADNLYIKDSMFVIEYDNNIKIFENNIMKKEITDAKLLDVNENHMLYNKRNDIYLYDLNSQISIFISSNSYNGVLAIDSVIFESDWDDNHVCKNVIESVYYRNCYKIYKYDITSRKISDIKLLGEDNYINDSDGEYISFTSIHRVDDICKSVCSYVNIYNLDTEEIITIDKYEDIYLNMSGNSIIDDNIVYFESVPGIYDCFNNQIFTFNIINKSIDLITQSNNKCFNENNEVLVSNKGYLIFRSKYGNYDDNNLINYMYSYKDNKYKKVDNNCKNKEILDLDYNNIYCLEKENILIYAIDTVPPTINNQKIYVALKENKDSLIKNLEYDDDLSNRENIQIELLSNLSEVGINEIKIKLCDQYQNCKESLITVDIIDKDLVPPKIYCSESITIKDNQLFDINNYGYALDNVDGKVLLEVVTPINYKEIGSRIILIKSIDSSGNISYSEIELTIYSNLKINFIYISTLLFALILIIIIYILRFKNRNKF